MFAKAKSKPSLHCALPHITNNAYFREASAMSDSLFKVGMTAFMLAGAALFVFLAMSVIDHIAPGQYWVAMVGTLSVLTAGLGGVTGIVAAFLDIWA